MEGKNYSGVGTQTLTTAQPATALESRSSEGPPAGAKEHAFPSCPPLRAPANLLYPIPTTVHTPMEFYPLPPFSVPAVGLVEA